MSNNDLAEQRNVGCHSPSCNHRAKLYAIAQNQNADCLMMTSSPKFDMLRQQQAMPCNESRPASNFLSY